jgi:hypothetical protein
MRFSILLSLVLLGFTGCTVVHEPAAPATSTTYVTPAPAQTYVTPSTAYVAPAPAVVVR